MDSRTVDDSGRRPRRFGAILEDGRRRLVPLLFLMFVAMGVATALVLPPFQVPDETTHWAVANVRADPWLGDDPQRCTGVVSVFDHFGLDDVRFNPEVKTPRGRFETLDAVTKSCEQREWVPYGSAFTYPGVLIARALSLGEDDSVSELMRVFYAGRLLHGLLVALLLWRLLAVSLRRKKGLTPGVLTIAAFCLAPLFMHQAFAISSDPICYAWALCLAHWLLHWKHRTWVDLALYAAIGFIVAGTKPVFLPLAPAALVLGWVVHEWRPGNSIRQTLKRTFSSRRWLRSLTVWAVALLLVMPIPGLVSIDNSNIQTATWSAKECPSSTTNNCSSTAPARSSGC